MTLTREIMAEVYRRFAVDRSGVSSRDLEWLRKKLRKYCDEPELEDPKQPLVRTSEEEQALHAARSQKLKEAHRSIEQSMTAKALAARPMSPAQIASYLIATRGQL